MTTGDIISIAASVVVPVLVVIITNPIKKSFKDMDKKKDEEFRDRKIMHAKIDSIVFGLKQMNGDTSVKFGKVYDETFKDRMDEIKYVHS